MSDQPINLSNTVPAAPAETINVTWEADAPGAITVTRNVSANVPFATATTPGVVQPDGSSITINATTGVISAVSGASDIDFNSLASGSNTTAEMIVGSGATLEATGTGVINATEVNGIPITGTLTHAGQIPISQPGNTTAVWADPLVQGIQAAGTAASTVYPVLIAGVNGGGNLTNLEVDTGGAVSVNVNGTVPVTLSGTPSVSVSNFPTTQPVSGTVNANITAGTVEVINYSDINGAYKLLVDGSGVTQPVSGTVAVSSVSGTVEVINYSDINGAYKLLVDGSGVTQPVSGTVALTSGDISSLTPPTAAAIAAAFASPLPVSLPSATVTTLTPPTAASIGTAVAAPSASTIGTAVAAALTNPLPVHDASPASQAVTNAGTFAVQAGVPALGQALASASLPVILPSATITTLTPPTAAAIGTAVAAPTASAIGTSVSTDLLTGTQLASASVPVALPTATITTLTPPTASAIGTAVAAPTAAAVASAIAANPPTTPLPTAQVTTLTPPTAAAIGTAVAAPTAAAIASAIVANPPTTPLPSAQITTLTPPTAAAIGTAVAAPTAAAIAAALTDQAINVAQWDGTPVGAPVPFGNNPTFTGGVATNYATTGAPGPTAIAIDASGNAWIVGTSGAIQMAPNGTVNYTVTPTGSLRGVALDGSGNVWVADNTANSIIEYSSTGALLNTYTTGINGPRQIAFDDFGNLWVPNWGTTTVVKLSSAGSVLATVTVGSEPFGIAIDAENNVWTPCNGVNTLVKISNAGTVLGTFPTGASPVGCAVDSVGNIWVANSGATSSVMMFSNLGVLLTTTQIPGSHQLKSPCIDSHGNVWIGDEGASSSVFVFTPAGVLLTTLTAPSGVYAMALDASGNMWGANTVSNQVNKFSPISMSNALGVNAALFSGNVPLTNTAGALNTNISSSITLAVTQAGTVAVSATTAANTKTNPIYDSITDGTNVITAAISALGTAPTGTDVMAVNNVPLPTTLAGTALSATFINASGAAVSIKASAGNLYGFTLSNGTAATAFVEFFNTAAVPTLGTTAVVFCVQLPASVSITLPPASFALLNFATGIGFAVTTIENGTVAAAVTGMIFYK